VVLDAVGWLTVKWAAFQHDGRIYDLSHLHPRTLQFERPATENLPTVIFKVDVTFGQHCFSRGLPRVGTHDKALECTDGRETRLFDFERWELSKRLPEIIQTLDERKCRNTGQGNFFTIEIVTESGRKRDYDVFFAASKSSRKGTINLYVQSAYVREKNNQLSGKPIGFLVILHNTLHKVPIKG
jgi:hypothetical protein